MRFFAFDVESAALANVYRVYQERKCLIPHLNAKNYEAMLNNTGVAALINEILQSAGETLTNLKR